MERQSTLKETIKQSGVALGIEFIGTMFMTLLFNSQVEANGETAFVVGFWVIVMFGFKLSGAHYNPAITLAFMLRRDVGPRFPRLLGLAYIVFQMGGACVGSLLAWFFNNEPGKLSIKNDTYYFQAMISETLGAWFLVFFYLTQTEHKYKFSDDLSIQCLIIASSYVAAREMCAGPVDNAAVLNPAIGFSTGLAMILTDASHFDKIWLFPVFPFFGGLLAVAFYEFVYKKAHEVLTEEEEEEAVNHLKTAAEEDE